ncbi:MAG: hypothetical protein IT445_17390 [Phycisphaeraceae bacterium]|nr:hypothetical protein [Phycisphaeraceae bacterium]
MQLLDIAILVLYLGSCVVLGILYGGKQKGASDYFVAGGGMHGRFNTILVGLSLAATLFSGISFFMLPSIFYDGGTAFILSVLMLPFAWLVLNYWFLPRYLRGSAHQKPYDIVQQRFGPHVRTTVALMYLLFRVSWLATLIYAPTIAIMGAAQLEIGWFWPLVLMIGVCSTIYTVAGGLRGVILTEAIQFMVMTAGIILVLGYIFWSLPLSLSEALRQAIDDGQFETFDFSFSLETMTIWAVMVSSFTFKIGNYIGDQMSLQRYLVSGNRGESSRSFLINMMGIFSVVLLLALVGVGLKAWYLAVPSAAVPANPDKVFPYFIATELPAGITGLLMAAILAATMSSMASGINTLAAVLTYDLRARCWTHRPQSDIEQLYFGRIASLLIGVAATISAGAVGLIGSLFDIVQTLLGTFVGPITACVLLAVTTLRVAPSAMLCGMIVGALTGWAVAWSPLYSLWVGPMSFLACLLATWLLTTLLRGRGAMEPLYHVPSGEV